MAGIDKTFAQMNFYWWWPPAADLERKSKENPFTSRHLTLFELAISKACSVIVFLPQMCPVVFGMPFLFLSVFIYII